MAVDIQEQEWFAYYERFPYFGSDRIREGSQPRLMEHSEPTDEAIVLVHGLTDSPYYMMEIARFFHVELGYNVYVPLLQCHGLKEPMGMKGVSAEEWKQNVQFAIESAAKKASRVSVGGLSTGGTLSVYMAATNPQVNGGLFLFSAALDLAGGFWGQVKEKVLRSPVADFIDTVDKIKFMDKSDRKKSLIGINPYRYNQMDKGGAKQLSYLIKEIDIMIEDEQLGDMLNRPTFAAHSESDTTTSVEGIQKLADLYDPSVFTFYRIPRSENVSHASLVLKHPVYHPEQNGERLEASNPHFDDMMGAIRQFLQK